ncbi:MAG: hypothetical protein Q7S86_02770 [bacterium]|nr:hypothetical protein [bacterium]
MEGNTHYEKVVGGGPEEKQAALQELQKLFAGYPEGFAPYELPKTPEDVEIITKTVEAVDEIVRNYGGTPKSFPLEKIHILKPDSVALITGGKFGRAIHKPIGEHIGVEKQDSRLGLAGSVAHELFHQKAYKVAYVDESGGLGMYRTGLTLVDYKDKTKSFGKEKEYFGKLEEAIVAECVREFLDKVKEEPIFKDEVTATLQFKNWLVAYFLREDASSGRKAVLGEMLSELYYITKIQERVEDVMSYSSDEKKRAAYAAGMFRRLAEAGDVEQHERLRERKNLSALTSTIIRSSKNLSRDEFFAEFARAHFSGSYLSIARIIESALGKGSFRKLANKFAVIPD